MGALDMLPPGDGPGHELSVFEQIALGLQHQGWVVVANALPSGLAADLFAQVRTDSECRFALAGVGRSSDHVLNRFIRRDRIRWIEGTGETEQQWLAWCGRLQTFLNRQLFLGLFSFESHFAHYQPGDFYKKHVDAFRPDGSERGARRVVSLVTYLNPGWQLADGGELVVYDVDGDAALQKVMPAYGTVVVFLSTEVPHEVLPSTRDRYSIAGWFRVNGSVADRPDPPR
ncbi:MAG: 2OG-Fe(II) oxygenase [Pseudohongiella sp.]|uniref:2OG-Fe(II) oxygenase n=1 Tax=Pseudohongiella sp. TaxID=1979412 RepID=UPI0034A0317A